MFCPNLFKPLAVILLFSLVTLGVPRAAHAEGAAPRYKAVAFDYFVIFNPNSVVPAVEKVFPGKGMDIVKLWRTKQFEYCFLRSITAAHADFFKVTQDALDYALESMKLAATAAQKQEMMNAYLTLTPWPDAAAGLQKLRAHGIKIITIANFSGSMLRANAEHAGIAPLFDNLLSTEAGSVYKPEAAAYALGLSQLGLQKEEVVFAAFGGWDAYGAKKFGYPTYWVNRFGLPAEKLDVEADATSVDFEGLLAFVLGDAATDTSVPQ